MYFKLLFVTIIASLLTPIKKEYNICGNYNDYFGGSLHIKKDSTYYYSFSFDLISSWTMGKWKMNEKNLILEPDTIYDSIPNPFRVNKAEYVLSLDSVAERISDLDKERYKKLSGGQHFFPSPTILRFRKNRLYSLNKSGRVMKRKRRGLWTHKRYPLYFFKT